MNTPNNARVSNGNIKTSNDLYIYIHSLISDALMKFHIVLVRLVTAIRNENSGKEEVRKDSGGIIPKIRSEENEYLMCVDLVVTF